VSQSSTKLIINKTKETPKHQRFSVTQSSLNSQARQIYANGVAESENSHLK